MEFTLNCKLAPSDGEDDRIVVSRDYDGDIRFRLYGDSVFTNDAGARAFAHKLLALVGGEEETAPQPASVKVGDRVEITNDDIRSLIGKEGAVLHVDTDEDTAYPYVVQTDGSVGGVWVKAVRAVTVPVEPATLGGRVSLLEEAHRIAGPGVDADIVIAYAKYLAGE
jgi:hypothetical protein